MPQGQALGEKALNISNCWVYRTGREGRVSEGALELGSVKTSAWVITGLGQKKVPVLSIPQPRNSTFEREKTCIAHNRDHGNG